MCYKQLDDVSRKIYGKFVEEWGIHEKQLSDSLDAVESLDVSSFLFWTSWKYSSVFDVESAVNAHFSAYESKRYK